MAFKLEIADFGAFYERTYQGAYRTAIGIVRDPALAADVAQEAYLAAYRDRLRFRGDAPGAAWLHRIVVNQALMALRRRAPGPREIRRDDPDQPGEAATIARLSLFEALAELTPRQRAAIVLRYYHDYDYATIARCLGTSTTNVGVMLSRALGRLRAVMEPADSSTAGTGR